MSEKLLELAAKLRGEELLIKSEQSQILTLNKEVSEVSIFFMTSMLIKVLR